MAETEKQTNKKQKTQNAGFNPIKQEVDGKRAMKVIWSTKTLDTAIKGLEQGKKLVANPFYENNVRILKGDLVFERTDEERMEWLKCRDDIIYFANTYCKLMTPEGVKKVEMRDYQEDYLRHLEKNRLSIFLSCRQSGKCVEMTETIRIKSGNDCIKFPENWDIYRCSDEEYEIPLFELFNLSKSKFDFKWKLEYGLYKLLYKSKGKSRAITKILSLLDNIEEYDEKLIESHILDGILIWTDTGWQKATYIHKTKPFNIYTLKLRSGRILRCADEHIVYNMDMDEVWVKSLKPGSGIVTDTGIDIVDSISFTNTKISMCDVTVWSEDQRYYTSGILSHNTTTSSIFMLHYILFNYDKNSLVLGNKRDTAIDILSKLKRIFYEIPFFLKPGVYKWNESEIVLDNGCMCKAESTTEKSGIGMTLHCVLADEFAHIAPNIQTKFYNNLFPVITAGRARFIISSTQNGRELFYRIYQNAMTSPDSEYSPFKVDWWQVPEWDPDKHIWYKRDEAWKRIQVANLGGEDAFNSQFGTNFEISDKALICKDKLMKMYDEQKDFINKPMPGCEGHNFWFWHPDFDPSTDLKRSHIVFTIDISEGKRGDYTIFMVNRVRKTGEENTYETVGYFRANSLQLKTCCNYLEQMIVTLCGRYMISLETNLYGELFIEYITASEHISKENFIKFYTPRGFTLGIRINSKNKREYCSLFKNYIETGIITNESGVFYQEALNFEDSSGNGTYKAAFGHDDLIMAQMQICMIQQSLNFKYFVEEYNSLDENISKDAYNPYSDMINPYENIKYWSGPHTEMELMTANELEAVKRLR